MRIPPDSVSWAALLSSTNIDTQKKTKQRKNINLNLLISPLLFFEIKQPPKTGGQGVANQFINDSASYDKRPPDQRTGTVTVQKHRNINLTMLSHRINWASIALKPISWIQGNYIIKKQTLKPYYYISMPKNNFAPSPIKNATSVTPKQIKNISRKLGQNFVCDNLDFT